MTTEEFVAALRAADENDVIDALDEAYIQLPITSHVEALELFNCMLDVLTGERDEAKAADEAMVARFARRRGSEGQTDA